MMPIFVDVTWGAAGSTKALTLTISEYAQKFFGVSVLMHITCYNISVDEMRSILKSAKDAGIKNILALRGDPPRGSMQWSSTGFRRAIDLVKFIRAEYGDYFCIAVAGYPEGHPQSSGDVERDVNFLKEKVDAGADFVLTQFFYDTSAFISYLNLCRAKGITCPIIPGMMPIQSFSSFKSMTSFCCTKVPEDIIDQLVPIQHDDEAVKAFGIKLCSSMCKTLLAAGVKGFHFYTLNLETSVMSVLRELNIGDKDASKR
jgi:methylenetetrahydrofolate reductase (NADPH)